MIVTVNKKELMKIIGKTLSLKKLEDTLFQPGLKEFPIKKSGKKIIVGKGLEKIRRYISCGIVRDVEINDELIKDYMQLQDALTATHGRNRRKASIGLYVFDDIKFPIHYALEKPERISFEPLGYEEVMNGKTIIEQHEKGIEFGQIISKFPKWPLLIDSDNQSSIEYYGHVSSTKKR